LLNGNCMVILSAGMAGLWAQWLWPILLLVVGLGAVIFFHELGHFVLAKAVGIQVERFALGFGPRLFGVVLGETDYCLNLLPLGGYVKMLGQEDFKPLPDEQPNPRAFNNKSVGARMAVVSAGVIMNVILAAILFVVVCLMGIPFVAPVVGTVAPGYPAATAEIHWLDAGASTATTAPATGPASRPAESIGLKPGDHIVEIDGDKITRFGMLDIRSALAGADSEFVMVIERNVDGRTRTGKAVVGVKGLKTARGGERFAFGISPAPSTTLTGLTDTTADDPFEEGDRVVAVDGRPVESFLDIAAAEKKMTGRPVSVTVLRDGERVTVTIQPAMEGGKVPGVVVVDGETLTGLLLHAGDREVRIRTADGKAQSFSASAASVQAFEYLDILGMTPRMTVTGVVNGSPADDAGLRPGDIVVRLGDHDTPTWQQFSEIVEKSAGAATTIEVLRVRDGPPERVTMEIRPTQRNGRVVIGVLRNVDIAHAVVAGVRPGSTASGRGILPDDRITAINGQAVSTWIDVSDALKANLGGTVTITYRRGANRREATIEKLKTSQFDPRNYRFSLFPGPRGPGLLMSPPIKKNPIAAVGWGVQEAGRFVVMTYATLHTFMQGNISATEFSGPVGIGGMAIRAGRQSLVRFIYFMAMISISLAVVNFLPFPVVDGGHAVFLIIEKIRGKPIPVKIQNIAQMIGLALILMVFVALTWQDIAVMIRGLW